MDPALSFLVSLRNNRKSAILVTGTLSGCRSFLSHHSLNELHLASYTDLVDALCTLSMATADRDEKPLVFRHPVIIPTRVAGTLTGWGGVAWSLGE